MEKSILRNHCALTFLSCPCQKYNKPFVQVPDHPEGESKHGDQPFEVEQVQTLWAAGACWSLMSPGFSWIFKGIILEREKKFNNKYILSSVFEDLPGFHPQECCETRFYQGVLSNYSEWSFTILFKLLVTFLSYTCTGLACSQTDSEWLWVVALHEPSAAAGKSCDLQGTRAHPRHHHVAPRGAWGHHWARWPSLHGLRQSVGRSEQNHAMFRIIICTL